MLRVAFYFSERTDFMLFTKKKTCTSLSENGFEIRTASDEKEFRSALQLAEDVFMEFEAPLFGERGVESFKAFIWGRRVQDMIESGEFPIWCCYKENQLVGMMALRDRSHISLAFVRGDFHRQGIGRMLFAQAKRYAKMNFKRSMTVNASAFGIPFYRSLGFRETDMENVVDGIASTPMTIKI